jgi:hypothetical protein
MQHLVLNKNLVLVEIPVPKVVGTKPATMQGINHIWEIDRSGSMGMLLRPLIKDLKAKVRELPVGDTVTVGWFSGEGQRSFVLKGFKLGGVEDFAVLDRVFDQMEYTVGMTCFSEILADTAEVIKDLSVFGDKFALCFFTDGYPVVSNYGREIERINVAIDAVRGKLTAGLMVGYGDYYNKELMTRMAERMGANLIHSSDLPSFSVAFKTFTEDAREATGKAVEVSYEGVLGVQALFSINGKQINVIEAQKAAKVMVPLTSRAKDTLYVLASAAPMTSKEIKLTDKAFVGRTASQEALIKGAYAAACVLTQRTKTDVAMEVLGTLGDKALIDAVTNAFTVAEYGAAEDQLREAMAGPSKRLTKGRDTSYVPPANAYCLLDLLDDLRDAKFLPAHPAFEYKRVGKASENKEGFGKFEYAKNAETPLNAFVWNESRLNLSVLAKINGTVELQPRDGNGAEDFGLMPKYPAAVYRNFTIVKDGALNITKLPVKGLSADLAAALMAAGFVVEKEAHMSQQPEDFKYILDLTKLPIVNRSIADGKTSAKALCKLVSADLDFRGELKALKCYRDALEEAQEKALAGLTKAEGAVKDFLESNGIKVDSGIYSPGKDTVEATDFYEAKTFDISIKGASSLPKVADVAEKLKAGKALKVNEEGIAAGTKAYQASGMENQSAPVALAWLKDRIEKTSEAQRKNRRAIQETKFSIILGKKWFDEFTSREGQTLELDGRVFKFELGTEKVHF